MSRNGSGPAPAVTEGKARKSDLLSSKITSKVSTASPEYKFHPLAALVPPMSDEEYETLAADIKANGLNESIVLHGGMILDGCHRYRACKEAGVEPSFIDYLSTRHGHEINDPAAYVVSVNIHRRHLHLTADQKRELIAKLIKAEPEKSDRAIGKMAKASKNTAAAVRRGLEARGQIDHVEQRTDTKGRKQPAKKKAVEGVRAGNKREGADRKALYDEGCRLLKRMDRNTRVKFFKYQEQKYLACFEEERDSFERHIEHLNSEIAKLRQKLDPGRCAWEKTDGGRSAARYEGSAGDCGARAVSIATGKPYAEVFGALQAAYAKYIKRHPRSWLAKRDSRRRTEPIENGCAPQVMRSYMQSIGWQYTEPKEHLFLRADMLPKGRLVVAISRHLVAVIDGVIHDTHDCGGAGRVTVEGYWSQTPPIVDDPIAEALTNAGDAEASAAAMKAKHAEMDAPSLAGNDPGPFPEFLVREPVAK
jgi:hypothetical protein